MYIVTATNDDYAKHLGVMLNSLLENQKETTDIKIFIIDGNISTINKWKLEKVVGRFNLPTNFITVDNNLSDLFENYKTNFSKEAYYRITIPELLSRDISKALYLDCDMIVKEDLSSLWNINISDFFLAAVEDLGLKQKWKNLLIPAGSSYFNSGLMLINLKKWRDNNISTQVIQYIKDNYTKIKFPDQDALNVILQDKWLKLAPEWNYTTGMLKRYPIDNPAIIHFTGRKKPWNSEHPFKQEYLKYLDFSLWEQEN